MNIRGWILVVVILLCLIFAGVSYNRLASRLPHKITIASGSEAGEYHHLAQQLRGLLKLEYPRIRVEIEKTNGSADNLDRVIAGQVQFAFYQNNRRLERREAKGKMSDNNNDTDLDVRAVANLYAEVLHIVIRKDAGIKKIQDLREKSVSLGATGSGTLQIAEQVLQHYNMRTDEKDMHALNLVDTLKAFESEEIDAAFIVTGDLSQSLTNLLRSGKYDLLPLKDTRALIFKNAALFPFMLPRTVYCGEPPVPSEDTPCLGVKASLITHHEVPAFLVRTMTQMALSSSFRKGLSELTEEFARDEQDFSIHRGAADFYNRGEPTFSSSVAEAFTDTLPYLLVLTILVIVVGATLRQNFVEKRRHMNARLHEFMTQVGDIEADQRGERDLHQLFRLFDLLSRIKKRAVDDRVEGRLTAGDEYIAFMVQLAGLINTIQSKIFVLSAPRLEMPTTQTVDPKNEI